MKGVRCAFVFFEKVPRTSGDDRITSKNLFTITFQEMLAKVPSGQLPRIAFRLPTTILWALVDLVTGSLVLVYHRVVAMLENFLVLTSG